MKNKFSLLKGANAQSPVPQAWSPSPTGFPRILNPIPQPCHSLAPMAEEMLDRVQRVGNSSIWIVSIFTCALWCGHRGFGLRPQFSLCYAKLKMN